MTKPKIYFGVLGAVIPFYRGAPPYSLQARTRRPLIHFHIFFYDVSILIHHHPCQCWLPVDVRERKGRERGTREKERVEHLQWRLFSCFPEKEAENK
jgi:hypothetical protein